MNFSSIWNGIPLNPHHYLSQYPIWDHLSSSNRSWTVCPWFVQQIRQHQIKIPMSRKSNWNDGFRVKSHVRTEGVILSSQIILSKNWNLKKNPCWKLNVFVQTTVIFLFRLFPALLEFQTNQIKYTCVYTCEKTDSMT